MMIACNLITIWKNIKDTINPQYSTIGDWLNLIKNTPEPYLSVIDKARSVTKGSKSYDVLKKQLPVAQLNGSFPDRKKSSCNGLSGYAYLDIDDCDMGFISDLLKQSPYVYSFWRSVSNTGYGILVKYEQDLDIDFNLLLEELGQSIGIAIDKNAKGLARTNFLSSDSDLYINPNVRSYVTKKPITKIIKKEQSISINERFFRNESTSPDLVFQTYLESYPQPVVFESRPYFKAFWPWASKSTPLKIFKGNRNVIMTCFINNLRLLNPDKKEAVQALVYSYNKNYCLPNLSSADVKKMIEYSYSRTDLQPIGVRIKKIWVDPAYKGDKRKAIGQYKKNDTVNRIQDYLAEAFCKDEKITHKKIADATGLSPITVSRYLVFYKEDVKEFNKVLIESRPKIPRSRVKNITLI